MMGPRCTWLFLFVLVCVTDSIKGFFRCRGYWSILLSICCVYIYICSAGSVELLIVLLYLLRCLVYHMLSNTRRNSRSLYRVIAYMILDDTKRHTIIKRGTEASSASLCPVERLPLSLHTHGAFVTIWAPIRSGPIFPHLCVPVSPSPVTREASRDCGARLAPRQ